MSYHKVCGQKLTCGSCRYLEKDRIYTEPCVSTGKIISSKACTQYSPDSFRLVNSANRIDQIVNFSDTINQMSSGDLMILAGLLLRVRHLKKYGYRFFQKVYIRINLPAHKNYLSSFASGYLVDATKDMVRIVSSDTSGNVCSYTLLNEKDSSSFYTVERFNPIRKEIFETQAFVCPDVHHFSAKVIHHEVPSLADADAAEAIDYKLRGSRKIRKSDKDDLVSAITRMQRGFLKPKKAGKESLDQVVDVHWG